MSQPNRKQDEKFVVRLPLGMRNQIAQCARDESRSMNSEIIYRLEKYREAVEERALLKQALAQLLQSTGEQPEGV